MMQTHDLLPTDLGLSLGHSVLEANAIENGRPVITSNYVGPNHDLPLPYPDGDWYLRQTFVPAIRSGETVISHRLIPGLRDHYARIGLLPTGAEIIEVESHRHGSGYGFPATDALEILRGNVAFGDTEVPQYLCSTFTGQMVDEQARALNLRTLPGRAESSLSNHKSRLREGAEEYGFTVLPGRTVYSWDDLNEVADASWNTDDGTWLKFPTGSGGDLVIRIKEKATEEVLHVAVNQLRDNIQKAFAEGDFATSFKEFWPEDRLSPVGFPLSIEADVNHVGRLVANGSTQFVSRKNGDTSIVGHFVQLTTDIGEYLGNEPYVDMPDDIREMAEAQSLRVADYNVSEHNYYGIAGVDWFVTESEGRRKVWVVELNSRPTANTPPVIIAQKLGASHFLNTNVYTDTPIRNIDDFVGLIGEDLAFGDPNESGIVVPQAFRTIVQREGTQPSPNFKIAILGRDSVHCRSVANLLSRAGIRFEP